MELTSRASGCSLTIILTLAIHVLAAAVTDAEAERRALGSVFVGNITAEWEDPAQKKCPLGKLVVAGARLTCGPSRFEEAGFEEIPFFISLIGSNGSSTISVKSALSNSTAKLQWWDVSAKASGEGYHMNGYLRNGGGLSSNGLNGTTSTNGAEKDCPVGDVSWQYEAGKATFAGSLSPEFATYNGSGTWVRELAEGKKQSGTFLIKFEGKWDGISAKLNTEGSEPSWPVPGKPESSASASSSQVSTSSASASSTLALGHLLPAATTTTSYIGLSTLTPTSSPSATTDSSSLGPLKSGGVAGIIVGGVAAAAISGAVLFWWLRKRNEKRNMVQVYPEVAYIFAPSTTPQASETEYTGSYFSSPSPFESAARTRERDMRNVLIHDETLPVEEQRQLRRF